MSLSSPFIRRPVATTLLTAAIALIGGVAFPFLPVSSLPQVDFPTIQVNGNLPGASAEIMASSLATPLERQFGRIAGITEMTSASSLGSTNITLQFDLDRDVNGAARDVQAAINAARSYMPPNLPTNPTYRRVNPAEPSILVLVLTSKIYKREALYDAASTIVQQKLLQVDGVGQVNVGGGALPAVRVEVNPTQLYGAGLGLQDVATMLSAQNVNLPKGQISNEATTADIVANDQLLKADQYKNLIVGYHNGSAIKLSDVAEVQDSAENIRSAAWADGTPCVLLFVNREPGKNIIDSVDQIKKELPSIKASLPAAIDFGIMLDRTLGIRSSVAEAERTLGVSVILVILVVFLFLRNFRVTFIPAVAVPTCLIGTFGAIYLCGYSIDNLSLMALTISTGFLVDDAIVVIENITRHLERGRRPLTAALDGAREIGFTVVSMSASLTAVFIPILLMAGIVGRLFREFAVTLVAAIGFSLLMSLTATPMLCSRLLKPDEEDGHNWIYQASEKMFSSLLRGYDLTLRWVLRHEGLVLTILVLVVSLNIYLMVIVPKGFFPEQDNGTIQGGILGSQDISYQAMESLTKRFVDILRSDPGIAHAVASTGGGATNTGSVWIGLKPLEERKISSSQVIARLRPKLTSLPGASVYLQAGQDLRIGARTSSAQFQYTIQSDKVSDLVRWGPTLLQQMKKLPGLTDVSSDQQNDGLQASLRYDRKTASRMGITARTIDNTLYQTFGQDQVSTLYTSLNQYHVVMEVAPRFWQGPEGLKDVYVRPTIGAEIPLGAISRFEPTTAPLAVNHQGQFPSVTVSFNLAPGVALSDASRDITAMEQNMGMSASIRGMFSGTLQAYQDSLATEPVLIIAALMAVYIVLGVLYESYIHPITILSTLPSAGVGAVLALMLFHIEFSVIALIGVLLLVGIVQKNAILMIDFAIGRQRNEHEHATEAIYQACLLRFRPILMTTMAAIFGALPLALGSGTGAELRRPLGIAIVGGLLFSQPLTLYSTPIVYLYLDRLGRWRKPSPYQQLSTVPQETGD